MKYTDVPEEHWAYSNIVWATRLQLVRGYPDRTFRPEEYVTRAEVASIALRCVLASTVAATGIMAAGFVIDKVIESRKG